MPAGKPRPTKTVQDGHSVAEHHVYQTLWALGKNTPRPDGSRIARISLQDLAKRTRQSVPTVVQHLKSLVTKLSIGKTIHPNCWKTSEPNTYRIHPFDAILKRRRKAGLTHYARGGGGRVELVGPTKESEVPPTKESEVAPLLKTLKHPPTKDSLEKEIGKSTAAGVQAQAPPREANNSEGTSSSSSVHSGNGKPRTGEPTTTTAGDLDQFVTGVQQFGWVIDQQIATETFNDCRARRTDCTVEELINLAGPLLSRSKTSPAGLLRSGLPKLVEGKPFDKFRAKRQRAAKREEEKRQRAERAQQGAEEWLRQRAADDERQRQWVLDQGMSEAQIAELVRVCQVGEMTAIRECGVVYSNYQTKHGSAATPDEGWPALFLKWVPTHFRKAGAA